MEKHRCKLCPRVFSNGRALGGHMRSHLATLPVKKTEHPPQLGDRTQSDSSSTRSENESTRPNYGLRENPKKSSKASDPEFLDAGSVVQDRESETESTQNLTRRPPKKKPRAAVAVKSESATESAPVSSVSDPGQDEEVALCLMKLSRDVWVVEENDSAELKTRSTRFKCLECKKKFRTNRALDGHKASSKECQKNDKYGQNHKIYECPFCYKVFGSGQALGGHKRSHLLGFGSSNTMKSTFILDLNLPAPVEDFET